MKIFYRHIFRNIKENKFRSFAIIVIVTLAVAVSFVSLSLQDVIDKTYSNVYNASVGDATVTIESKTGKPFINDLQLNGVDIAVISPMYDISGKLISGDNAQKVVFRGVDLPAFYSMNAVSFVQRPDDLNLKDNECIISYMTANKYSLSVGDEVEVLYSDVPYIIKIVGIAESSHTFYEEKGNIQILLSLDTVNLLNNTTNSITKLRLITITEPSVSVELLTNQNPDYKVYEGEEFETLHFQMQSVNGAMYVVMTIILLIGAYIISSIVNIIMLDRAPVVGTFRSVGANKKQILGVLSVEFLLYGVIGTAIGFILGLFLLPKVADLFNQYKEYGVATEVRYRPVYIIISLLIGTLLPVAVAIQKIAKENKKTLKNSVLQLDEDILVSNKTLIVPTLVCLIITIILFLVNSSDYFILGLLNIISLVILGVMLVKLLLNLVPAIVSKAKLLSGSSAVGMKNVKTNTYIKNNSSMIVAITLIFTIIFTIVMGIQKTAQMDLESYGFDVIAVTNSEQISEENIEKIQGVDEAFESFESMAFGDYANGYCRVYGIENFEKLNRYMTAIKYDGINLDAQLSSTKNGIVIDKYWAKTQKIDIGDTITLYTDDQRGYLAGNFTVVDLWDCSDGTTDRVFVGVSIESYKSIFEPIPERILIKTTQDPNTIATRLKNEYIDSNLSITSTEEFLAQQLSTVNTILALLFVAVVMAGIVIIVGISSNLVVAFHHRKKEYAILHSIGMSMKQVRSMLFSETITTTGIVLFVIITLAFPLVKILPKMTSGLGLIVNYSVEPLTVVLIVILTAVVLGLTMIVPVKKLNKLDIVKELKYE